jgi:hypothetical protein
MSDAPKQSVDKKNIQPRPTEDIAWDSAKPLESLRNVRKAVEEEGQKAIDW